MHAASQAHRKNVSKNRVPSLKTGELRECVITSRKPLIVRAGQKQDSSRVGQLQPGCKIYLLDVVEDAAGKNS